MPLNERLKTTDIMEPRLDPLYLPAINSAPSPLVAAKLDPFGWVFFIRMRIFWKPSAGSLRLKENRLSGAGTGGLLI